MFNTTVGRLVLTACVAGLIAAAIGGVSLARAGGTNHGRTIRVTEVDTGGKFISITHTANGGPGDEFIFSANLRHAGHKVGTLDAMCTLMLHNKLQCQGTFKLLGGTITGTALLPANEPTAAPITSPSPAAQAPSMERPVRSSARRSTTTSAGTSSASTNRQVGSGPPPDHAARAAGLIPSCHETSRSLPVSTS
jgi:hypothetical protein